VVVENKPGAGTTIGTSFVARSAPDGYTILVAQFPFSANPYLYKSLPYDTLKAFSPVVLAGRAPMVLVVNSNSPIKTTGDLLALAKSKPGSVNYGSSGSGSSNHLSMVLFEMMAGVSLNQIPYKGSTPLLTDLAGGQVEVAFDAYPHVRPFLQSGKIRPIAIATEVRSPLMADVPTVSESGVKGYEASSWHGFVVPSGTPQPVVDKLNRQINMILKQEDIRKTFNEQGVVPDGGTAAQFEAFIRKQMDVWKKVVSNAGITPE
jgi:tripartite-type tricarboxylate transporter receptor subunit TctC